MVCPQLRGQVTAQGSDAPRDDRAVRMLKVVEQQVEETQSRIPDPKDCSEGRWKTVLGTGTQNVGRFEQEQARVPVWEWGWEPKGDHVV